MQFPTNLSWHYEILFQLHDSFDIVFIGFWIFHAISFDFIHYIILEAFLFHLLVLYFFLIVLVFSDLLFLFLNKYDLLFLMVYLSPFSFPFPFPFPFSFSFPFPFPFPFIFLFLWLNLQCALSDQILVFPLQLQPIIEEFMIFFSFIGITSHIILSDFIFSSVIDFTFLVFRAILLSPTDTWYFIFSFSQLGYLSISFPSHFQVPFHEIADLSHEALINYFQDSSLYFSNLRFILNTHCYR